MSKLFLCLPLLFLLVSPVHAADELDEPTASDVAVGDSVEDPESIAEDQAEPDVDVLQGRGVEEIVVTAQKREQSLQEVPAAVSAFTEGQLDEAGIYQMQDLAFQVPNLHFGQEQGSARITIRGVSTSAGSDSGTAFHVDGIFINNQGFSSTLTFFDLEAIEVLRGPQGTLYGRNATGGVVNVISKAPSHDFEFFGDMQIGTYNETIARGVLNLPLAEDKVALRLSGFSNRRYGYQRNVFLNDPAVDTDDAGNAGIRAQLLVEPTEDLQAIFRFNWGRVRSSGFALKQDGPISPFVTFNFTAPNGNPVSLNLPVFVGAEPNPVNARNASLDTIGALNATRLQGNADIRWFGDDLPLLGDVELKVLGSYSNVSIFNSADQDATNLPVVKTVIGDGEQEWVGEVNLTSANDGDWTWLLGLFHFGATGKQEIAAPSNVRVCIPPTCPGFIPPSGIVPVNLDQVISDRAYSLAGFGHLTWDVMEDLTLGVGLRYSHDWKRSHFVHQELILPPIPVPLLAFIDEEKEDNWGRVSGMIDATWQFTEENMVYGRFSTGYKSGNIEHTINVIGTPPIPSDNTVPEDIFAVEIGSKNDLFDNLVRFNATAFFYWYKNLQVSQLIGSTIRRANAADARTFGIELEAYSRPWRELTIVANAAYLNAKFVTYTGCRAAEDPATVRDCSGNVLPRSPEFSGTLAVLYDFDLGRYGVFTPRVQVYGSDRVFFREFNIPADTQNAYWLLNLRAGWQDHDGSMSVELFVDNVLDKDIATTIIVGSSLIGSPLQKAYDRPRTAGIRFGYSF